ncbi:TetR/AcrR family transcriptional regulator [Streptomyces nanshensis]|uniref:TetR/AcrR family transcriptional regulator n=1 Tax=Streptomyces nanshensis TaxID=518642 RepID=UPI00085C7D8E|nr:TetR/AcrR family transcriptional regulator [Streptomyces nanshensis]
MVQVRAQLTRQALTMAAAKSFSLNGYERTTLTEVSGAADVSKGALSFHFSSKEDLAETVLREACSRTLQATRTLLEKRQPALRALMDLTHWVAHQLASDPLTQAAVRLVRELKTPSDPEVNLLDCWRSIFTEVAEKAEEEGTLRPGTTAEGVAELAFCIVASGAHSQQAGTEDADGSDVHHRLSGLWQMLLHGVVSNSGSSHSAGTGLDRRPTSNEPALAS